MSILFTLASCILVGSFSISASADFRLIETAPGERQWMTEEQVDALSLRLLTERRHGGYMDVTDQLDAELALPQAFVSLLPEVPSRDAEVERLLPELSASNLFASIETLSAFHNRFYKSPSGVQAAIWIRDRFLALAQGRTDVTVELISHSFPQPSVVATIQGHGPRAQERIVLGGHSDSISMSGGGLMADRRAPGADDNASGIATLLEVFRVLSESGYRPDRTIDFIAYAGEERGLLGSQDVAARYRKKNVSVVAVLQLDMTAYSGPHKTMAFVADYVNRPLTQFLQALVDRHVKMPWKEESCGYACSDHASWTKQGYASAFPFESFGGYNPHIHGDQDTLAHLDAELGLGFAKLGLAFAIEMAGEGS